MLRKLNTGRLRLRCLRRFPNPSNAMLWGADHVSFTLNDKALTTLMLVARSYLTLTGSWYACMKERGSQWVDPSGKPWSRRAALRTSSTGPQNRPAGRQAAST